MTRQTLQSSFIRSLECYPKVLVAFSGGLDSTVLLELLYQMQQSYAISVRAVHIHHGISRYADEWVDHCQRQCGQRQIPFTAIHVQLNDQGQGIEAQARLARYQALENELQPGEILLTAQHLNDQCETLLLALKRGSGPAGLAAMPEILPFADSLILRPLLGYSRAELESYASEQGLAWIEDDSNTDDSYDRNFLRLRVLPLLHQRWPHFSRMVSRSAQLCGEQEMLLDELLAEQLETVTGDKGELYIEPLFSASVPRRSAILRRWFAYHHAPMPSRAALQRLWDEVALSREDAAPRLQFNEYEVRRYQGALWWVRMHVSQRETQIVWNDLQEPLTLPDNLGCLVFGENGQRVRIPALDESVSVRFQASGHIHIVGRQGGRSMKKLWQELNVPGWLRDTTPLLFYGEQLIAACGVFVTRAGEPADEDECWFIDREMHE